MQVVGIDHIVLLVSDMDQMVDFYCRVFGCLIEHRQDPIGLVHLRAGVCLIDLVDRAGVLGKDSPGAAGPGRNLDHVCLRVEPFDADAVRAELTHHGVRSEPPERRFGANGYGHTIYLHDIEGNRIELRG